MVEEINDFKGGMAENYVNVQLTANGYKTYYWESERGAPCDQEAVKYYMAQCYVYFLQFSGDDAEYCDYIRTWVKRLICKRY